MILNKPVFYLSTDAPALQHAADYIQRQGFFFADSPSHSFTHLLLPVPSLDGNGCWKAEMPILPLPKHTVLVGGNIPPEAARGHPVIDLLADDIYLAQNASITAHCAIKVALRHWDRTFYRSRALIIGWGRIGKCLASLLTGLGAKVCVSARKEQDLALAAALGLDAVHTGLISSVASNFDIIFNTVPYPLLNTTECDPSCLLIELASTPGILGDGVIDARGLPGKEAPHSSGILIGKTVLRLVQEKGEFL